AQRFPTGKHASSAHWKAAWLNYRLGNMADAKRRFEDQIAVFPGSTEVPNALYWRGRLAEDEQELPRARAYYLKLTDRFRNYYYANLARERLRAIKSDEAAEEPLLAKVAQQMTQAQVLEVGDSSDNIRLQKSKLLSNAALFDY